MIASGFFSGWIFVSAHFTDEWRIDNRKFFGGEFWHLFDG
jgi:hypothetical protein